MHLGDSARAAAVIVTNLPINVNRILSAAPYADTKASHQARFTTGDAMQIIFSGETLLLRQFTTFQNSLM
ncbi:hypothetical protein KCP74_04485 [Salmonella enterica subsp. enterica]|nr:hypothetical protein KCP74_04485 [Salmonella enterica subsp. enterica]